MNFTFIVPRDCREDERNSVMREGGELEMQTCIKFEGIVGVVSMETKCEHEYRILLSLLSPERSKVWYPLSYQSCSKVWILD